MMTMADREGDRWPMAPACECGAVPGRDWPTCHDATLMQGCEDGDNADGCERWRRVAMAAGWLAGNGR